MAFSVRNKTTDSEAAEIAAVTGESKAAAVSQAVRERRERLRLEGLLPQAAETWIVRTVEPHRDGRPGSRARPR